MSDTAFLLKHAAIYGELKPIYAKYKKAKNKTAFAEQHRRELTLFEAATKKLKEKHVPSLDEVQQTVSALTQQKKELYEKYKN